MIDAETGTAKRGLLVRHLVLPNDQAGTDAIAEFLATNIGDNISCILVCTLQAFTSGQATIYLLSMKTLILTLFVFLMASDNNTV